MKQLVINTTNDVLDKINIDIPQEKDNTSNVTDSINYFLTIFKQTEKTKKKNDK